jgi:hypothetical protein
VKLTPRPSSRNNPYRKRDYVGIFPGCDTLRVKFEFGHPQLLDRLRRHKTLALAFPNRAAQEVDLKPIPNGKFFDVAPVDTVLQAQLIEQALTKAESHGVALVLFPELCVTPALAMGIAGVLRKQPRVLSMVLAGSYHLRVADKGVNRMEIHSAFSRTALQHDKLTQFELKSWKGIDYDPPLIEDIEPSGVITVNWSGGWSCVTLICKDFLDSDVRGLLALLRPNFIFVVAFSDSTAAFEANAQAMASDCQATVVICNFVPHSTENPAATVVLPIERRGRIVSAVKAASEVHGRLAVFQLERTDNLYEFKMIDIC